MQSTRTLLLLAAIAGAPLAITASYVSAQGAPQGAPQGGPPAGRGGPPGGDMGKELLDGLKATKGCLGVETAFTSTRKSVIFAWFEDKAATLRWYESDTHQTMMMGMNDGSGEEREPMAKVPDGVPVMCIATITPSQKPMIPGFPVPISQVSIELYTPLPGGIAVNGRFSPEGLEVEGLVEQKLEAPAAAPAGGDAKGGGS